MNIVEAVNDQRFFKPLFKGGLESWSSWLTFLKALFGLPIAERAERRLLKQCTGLKTSPKRRTQEAYVIAGRRSGKSFISSIIAVYLALFCDWRPFLSPGEKAWIFIIATDRAQAKIIKNYISGILASSPFFRRAVKKELRDEIELQNDVIIAVKTCDFRSIRGYTVVAAVCEELAFWRDEQSANPAQEILTALRPSLATVEDSLLIGISTPYSRSGILWEQFRSYFGRGRKEAPLIWKAATRTMNPTISKKLVDHALKEDYAAGKAEWLAEFREDIESFLPLELIEQAVIAGREELPKVEGVTYHAFCDPSGGRQDSFTLAVAHKDTNTGKIILDLVRETRPPFQPQKVVQEYSEILKSYGITQVESDRYAGEWVADSFRSHSIMVENSKLSASEIYLNFLPLISNGSVELLDSKRLVSQLRGLERKTRSGGKDLVAHYPGGHDDVANTAAGAAVRVHREGCYLRSEISYGISEPFESEEERMRKEAVEWLTGKKPKKRGAEDDGPKGSELEKEMMEKDGEVKNGGKNAHIVKVRRDW